MAAALGQPNIDIRGLTCDSRDVQPGFLFVALKGQQADGADFISDAVARGASAVLAETGTPVTVAREAHVPVITDQNPRRLYALMAARFYRAQPRTIAAVTGTNGKTSVVTFVRQIWESLGLSAASIGTLGVEAANYRYAAALTTPDPVALHRELAQLAKAGVDHLAMEASSHGLDQHRIDGVRVTAAAFTNLSREHLDYHGDIETYARAKMRLFDSVMAPDGDAVLNVDVPEFTLFAKACRERGHRLVTYGGRGANGHCDVQLLDLERLPAGQRLTVKIGGLRRTIETRLMGDFQAHNVLCALALAIVCGADADRALAAVPNLVVPKGRLERVGSHPAGAHIFVDYAHTPEALAAILKSLRPYAQGQLHVVFGCGGDRDVGKRADMGRMAGTLADNIIVTDDNPRTEDPAEIRAAVIAACPGAREIADRSQAIEAAVGAIKAGDILVVAGKGHETGQIVGDRILPFDDAEVIREALLGLERGRKSI